MFSVVRSLVAVVGLWTHDQLPSFGAEHFMLIAYRLLMSSVDLNLSCLVSVVVRVGSLVLTVCVLGLVCLCVVQVNVLTEVMRKELQNDVAALSLAPVPPGRRKSQYLVRASVTAPDTRHNGAIGTNDTIPSFGAEQPC